MLKQLSQKLNEIQKLQNIENQKKSNLEIINEIVSQDEVSKRSKT
jgi:hypothetical protein